MSPVDSFAYRHRVADVMAAPVATIGRAETLRQTSVRLAERRISALVVTGPDGAPCGIVTERDLVRCAASGADFNTTSVASAMTPDVITIGPEAFVYVAVGRMQRLGIRHLLVLDGGAMVGMASMRDLLRLQSAAAPAIGDAISAADSAEQVATALGELPGLAATLLAEGCTGHEVAAVISGVFRDATARAARHAETAMADRGLGPAPAAFAYLILGSGGRGESLLKPDQDNAIVHAGGDGDDPWFAEFGRLASDFLDAAGVPYCLGHVMASEPQWRRSADGWRREIGRWITRSEGESLLNVDIFFDFQPVHGDFDLATSLRRSALEIAAAAPLFLRLLAHQLDELASPFGLFGRLRTDPRNGRLDAKLGGVLPAAGAARLMALAAGSTQTSTPARLQAVVEASLIERDAADELMRAHGHILARILRQQVADKAAGLPPGNHVLLRSLSSSDRRRLVEALKSIDRARLLVRDALTAPVGPGALRRPG